MHASVEIWSNSYRCMPLSRSGVIVIDACLYRSSNYAFLYRRLVRIFKAINCNTSIIVIIIYACLCRSSNYACLYRNVVVIMHAFGFGKRKRRKYH